MLDLTIAELEALLKMLEPRKDTNEYAILYSKLQKAFITEAKKQK